MTDQDEVRQAALEELENTYRRSKGGNEFRKRLKEAMRDAELWEHRLPKEV